MVARRPGRAARFRLTLASRMRQSLIHDRTLPRCGRERHGRPREGRADREPPAAVPRARGSLLTPQRRAILRAVLDLDDHPTADRVHAALAAAACASPARRSSARSRASRASGSSRKACHPGSSVRYDGRTDLHHHLICIGCDRVIDFSDTHLDSLPVPDTRRFGFVVSDFKVQLRGTCRECREQEDKT